jgi:hypothetical protein
LSLRQPVTLPGPAKAQGAVKIFITSKYAELPTTGACRTACNGRQCRFPGDRPELYTTGLTGTCSGSALSDGLILFAAHCVDDEVSRFELRRDLNKEQQYPADVATDPCGINTLKIDITELKFCFDFDQQEAAHANDQTRCLASRTFLHCLWPLCLSHGSHADECWQMV